MVAVLQVLHLHDLLDTSEPLTAGYAKGLVLGYSVVTASLLAGAALLPPRALWWPVAAALTLAVPAFAATLVLGGEAWSFIAALLTMAAAWQAGRWLLHAVGAGSLAAVPAVAWLMGIGGIGMALLLAGRAGLLEWWTAGLPILLVGVLGLASSWRGLRRGGLRPLWSALTGTRLAAGSTALVVLTLGLASMWTAAPEMGYDALSYKAWLPSEWARTGEIAPQLTHPVLNFFGFAQIAAVPGHLTGAEGVGRYLQWLALAGMAATVWSAARRSPWAPVAAAALVLTPQLFFQATSAYDDAILALAAIGMALAVASALTLGESRAFATGLALGILAAACLNLKIHLVPIAAGLLLGWLIARGATGRGRALGGVLAGGLLASLPPMVLRWIDTGNPVMPSYNHVFKSPYWPLEHFSFGFPKLADPGPLGPLSTLWTVLSEPSRIDSYAPIGALGLLAAAIVVALVSTWRPRLHGGGSFALWLGLALGAGVWYLQFRNTRYLLPAGAMAVLLVALAARGVHPGRAAQSAGLAALALSAVLLWPSTVAQFFWVPGRDIPWQAAWGDVGDLEYENRSTAARAAVAAFDRLAPPGAVAVSDAHQRAWLTGGRDFSPWWEVELRLRSRRAHPTHPDETLRRVRELGVDWALRYHNPGIRRFAFFEHMIEEHGRPVWSSPVATLYRLPDPPP